MSSYHVTLILLHPLGFLHLTFVIAGVFTAEEIITPPLKVHIWCAVPCQPLPTEPPPSCHSPPQLTARLLRTFLWQSFLSVITFFLSFPTQVSPRLVTILPVFFSVRSSGESLPLFMFKNIISPPSIRFSPGIIFPDANPYIWTYLSVITMHKEHLNHWGKHWILTDSWHHLPGCKQIQVTFWKLHTNLLLSDGLQIPFWLWTPCSFQLRAGKKLSLNNDYTSASHGSPKRKICHFTSTFTVAILTKCPYATSSEHWVYAYLHRMCEEEHSSFTATSLRTVFCSCSI